MHDRGPIAEPGCSVQAREELAREASPVLAFVQECLTLDPNASISKELLYAAYIVYAAQNGLKPLSKSWFVRDLSTATAGKVKPERVQIDGDRVHHLVGARIIQPSPIPTSGQALPRPPTQSAEDVGGPDSADAELDERLKRFASQASSDTVQKAAAQAQADLSKVKAATRGV